MGCCCRRQKNPTNILSNQVRIIPQLKKPEELLAQPVVIPDSPKGLKSKKKELDIRTIDLLEMSHVMDHLSQTSIKSDESIINKFQQKIEELEQEQEQFNNKKTSIETQLVNSFVSDQTQSQNYSNNPELIGVKIKNRNICDIQNKYDFSEVKDFTEYRGQIYIERLIQKQKSSICTYIGKIEQKYCCVKLIPMAKQIHIDKWIKSVQIAQQQINNYFFQKYCYYKIEKIKEQPEYCNCFILCNLEQFNVYTFSHHQAITFREKVSVAPDIIQIIWFALQEYDQKHQSNPEKLSDQIFKTMFTVKRNNILISRCKIEKKLKAILSDWQLLLPEFEQIIPNKILQNQDNLFETLQQQQISQILYQNNRNLAQIAPNSQNLQDQIQLGIMNRQSQLVDKFSKYLMKLLFFRSNFELLNDVSLDGFFNQNEFQNKCEILRPIENQDLLLQKEN
ncbi:unnamed protein product (macronuclear) [Paramecium tetraurelia]|uniref:Uncharacterized protein n=1 Tax=Paramecium tetraurelia TaxID=5888 RepID=A0EAR8_PARTE|nr:uncharacterized protein GSPATT00025119001 [Paramecium tetraurelia]CAK92385.1 unnamed protein product [Paramecium tetraurelia]|eukprot:XP_001459782.1 hypothetical protein (macronuclear) [Paramecium tetraurelia strain d4-2]